jgi:hypothetical protein
VERSEALDLLPGLYGAALRLREAGRAEPDIADALEVDHESIAALLVIGERKLAALLARPSDPAPP